MSDSEERDAGRHRATRRTALRGDAGRQAFEDAWDEAYHQFSPRLHAILITRGFNADERADIVADTWLRAFEKIGQYTGAGSFGAWLAAIAARVASNTARSERTRVRNILVDPQSGSDTRDDELRLLERLDVSHRLEQITRRERALITLRASGHTHREIAQRLALPSERASRAWERPLGAAGSRTSIVLIPSRRSRRNTPETTTNAHPTFRPRRATWTRGNEPVAR